MKSFFSLLVFGSLYSLSVQADSQNPTRAFKCAASLNQGQSRNTFSALQEGFEVNMATMTSVMDGTIKLINMTTQKDMFAGQFQSFQIAGSLNEKRAVAFSNAGEFHYFATAKSMGSGFIEISKFSDGFERWVLVYNLICS